MSSPRARPTRRVPGTPASPTRLLGSTDGGRTLVARSRSFARRARLRAAGRTGAGAARCDAVGETGVYVGGGAGLGALRRPPAAAASPPARSGATRARASSSPTRRCRSTRRPEGVAGGVQVSEDGGPHLARRERRAARRRPRGRARARSWGPAQGLAAVARADRGLRALPARSPTSACAGSCCPAAARRPSTASRRRPTAGRTWTVVHEEADRPSTNLAASWIEPRAAEDGVLRLVRRALRPRGRPDRSRRRFATDLFRTYRTADGGETWAQVELREARRRPLDEPRPRRHERPTASTGTRSTRSASSSRTPTSASSAARTAARPGRARSKASRGAGATRPTGSLRPRGEGPRVGRLQRRPTTCRGRRCGGAPTPRASRAASASRRTAARHWTRVGHGHAGDRPSRTCSSIPRARRGSARSTPRRFGRGVYKSVDNGRTLGAEERGPRRRPGQPFAWRTHPRGRRHALPGRGAPQRARARSATPATARSTARRTAPSTGRASRCPPGTNGPNGLTVDPDGPEAALPLGLGRDAPRAATRAAGIFAEHDARRDLAPRAARRAARLRRDRRSSRPDRALRERVRPGGLPLGRPRRDLDAHPRLQLQVGPARDPRPARPVEDLRHDLRRQRLARARRRRPERGGGRGAVRPSPQRRPRRALVARPPSCLAAPGRRARLEQLVEANILGTHAYQIGLARKDGKGDPACWPPGRAHGRRSSRARRGAPGRAP